MIRWDVSLYRPRIQSQEKVQVYWAFVIMAIDYKAALKQVKGMHPDVHSSCIRLEGLRHAV